MTSYNSPNQSNLVMIWIAKHDEKKLSLSVPEKSHNMNAK